MATKLKPVCGALTLTLALGCLLYLYSAVLTTATTQADQDSSKNAESQTTQYVDLAPVSPEYTADAQPADQPVAKPVKKIKSATQQLADALRLHNSLLKSHEARLVAIERKLGLPTPLVERPAETGSLPGDDSNPKVDDTEYDGPYQPPQRRLLR